MVTYSISDLERLTGIKAHTVRAWEKRYGIFSPKRNESNVRYYEEQDLKLLQDISFLNNKGVRISKIAAMTPEEINMMISTHDTDNSRECLIRSIMDLNEGKCNTIIRKKITENGLKATMQDLLLPIFDQLAMMGLCGQLRPVHEKFTKQLIHKFCLAELEKLPCQCNSPVFLAFLPKSHNIVHLNFMHFLASEKGYNVLNLGHRVTLSDLQDIRRNINPTMVYTVLEDFTGEEAEEWVNNIINIFDNSEIYLVGQSIPFNTMTNQDRVKLFDSVIDADMALPPVEQYRVA